MLLERLWRANWWRAGRHLTSGETPLRERERESARARELEKEGERERVGVRRNERWVYQEDLLPTNCKALQLLALSSLF